MQKITLKYFSNFPKPLLGDYCIILTLTLLTFFLFNTLWVLEPATKLRISLGDHIHGEYSLKQTQDITVQGNIGPAIIRIEQGKVRFKQAPCNHQYCVHQGWLQKAGQVAICLPNHLSIELLGAKKNFDTLNY